MNIANRSIWVLYKHFFNTVPGQRALLIIGLLLIALGYLKVGLKESELAIAAGVAFISAFTLLFSGPQFRKLASVQRHHLTPSFRHSLIVSYLLVLATISVLILIGLILLRKQGASKVVGLEEVSTFALGISIYSSVLIMSLFGFLPGFLRYLFWLLLIVTMMKIKQANILTIEIFIATSVFIAIISLTAFIYRFGVSRKSVMYNKKSVSLSKYLPGLNGIFHEPGVTAVGSLLLGMSDGSLSRLLRSIFTAFILPITLFSSVLMTGNQSLSQMISNPLYVMVGLMMAMLVQIHFSFIVGSRRRYIWLRVGGSRKQINRLARKVLARERMITIICFGLWSFPSLVCWPVALPWLLGISLLLLLLSLLLEKIVFHFDDALSQRIRFYLLLSLIGLVVSIVGVAHIQAQPYTIWVTNLILITTLIGYDLFISLKSQ